MRHFYKGLVVCVSGMVLVWAMIMFNLFEVRRILMLFCHWVEHFR